MDNPWPTERSRQSRIELLLPKKDQLIKNLEKKIHSCQFAFPFKVSTGLIMKLTHKIKALIFQSVVVQDSKQWTELKKSRAAISIGSDKSCFLAIACF